LPDPVDSALWWPRARRIAVPAASARFVTLRWPTPSIRL
jgi:hypothetical protein